MSIFAKSLDVKLNPTLWSVLILSILILFLEMMLIRWIGTEIRIFSYLQNTVLVVCFLGLGMGCLSCNKRTSILDLVTPLTLLTLLLTAPFFGDQFRKISSYLSVIEGLNIWYSGVATSTYLKLAAVVFGLSMTFVIMLLIWECFVPLGRLLGRVFAVMPNTILAYSSNILGSLIGVWLFVLLGFWLCSPVIWGAVIVFLILVLFWQHIISDWRGILLLAVFSLCLWINSSTGDAILKLWSPYQKLELNEFPKSPNGKHLLVNNVGYQLLLDLSNRNINTHSEYFDPYRRGLSQYDIPYLLHPGAGKVLLVGAGTGNDSAGAIRNGVNDIVAVEIDPAIVEIGKKYHPEKPYSSSRVRIVNDDARAYFTNSEEKFDIIVFGLLDAHTANSNTNVRLDHYVYTLESLQSAKKLLNDNGIIVLSFGMSNDYIVGRMSGLMKAIFKADPIVFEVSASSYGWGGMIFVSGNPQYLNNQIEANQRLNDFISATRRPVSQYQIEVATDDWPYIYLENRTIPILYFLLALILGGLYFYQTKKLRVTGLIRTWERKDWHFFFLGAGFLLFEVQNISKAALVFGNTWIVNAVIVSGIMCMILLANFIVWRVSTLPMRFIYILLIISCVFLYLWDLSQFNSLNFWLKVFLVGGVTTLPMLFSGIIFIYSFDKVSQKDRSLGVNLFGSLVGGLLQSLSFIFGMKALLLIVCLFYLLAMNTRPEGKSRLLC